jgi:hypothetical protein
MFRHLVVKKLRPVVCVVRLPVNARRSGTSRLSINFVDERAADAFATRALVGEDVLQIAAPMPGKTLWIPWSACTFVRTCSRLFT